MIPKQLTNSEPGDLFLSSAGVGVIESVRKRFISLGRMERVFRYPHSRDQDETVRVP